MCFSVKHILSVAVFGESFGNYLYAPEKYYVNLSWPIMKRCTFAAWDSSRGK